MKGESQWVSGFGLFYDRYTEYECTFCFRGKLPLGAILAITVHSIIIYSAENLPFQHVIQACSSSWLQEHVTDVSERWVHKLFGMSSFSFSYYLGLGIRIYVGSSRNQPISFQAFYIINNHVSVR